MPELLIKAFLGAVVVIIIQLLTRTETPYLAGLAPLFPTLTLFSHYIVGTERTTTALKQTILFGMASMIPYFVYLLALYFLVDRFSLGVSLFLAVLCWGLTASVLILIWAR